MAATPAPQKRLKAAKSRGQNSLEHARARLTTHARSNAPAPAALIPAAALPTSTPPGLPTLSKLLEQNNEILRRLAALETTIGKIAAVVDGTHLVAKAIYAGPDGPRDLAVATLYDSDAGEDDVDEPVSTVSSVDPSA